MSTPAARSKLLAAVRPLGSFRMMAAGAAVGLAAGLAVAAFHHGVSALQRMALGYAAERFVPLPGHVSPLRVLVALVLGGFLVTLVSRLIRRRWKAEPVDAVEANALKGGRIGWGDAVAIVVPIAISAGSGASVGIEAAVTQLGAAMASRLGFRAKLSRTNQRTLVAAGAAAAIAAAYRAPVAGMLYAYELVLGVYNKRTLGVVGVAAITAVFVAWLLDGFGRPFADMQVAAPRWPDFLAAAALGAAGAFVGVAAMLCVTLAERALRRAAASEHARIALAAAALAGVAAFEPAVLGSGHAAIDAAVHGQIVGAAALSLLAAKIAASALSLGGGFRGGLFSAALLLGALLGQVGAWLAHLAGVTGLTLSLMPLVGMAAVGASIIGSPLAMVFLVLETTGDFNALVVVAIASIFASFLTDRMFGYSFATWRFQQRGLAIEGGHDVSRLAAATIERIVRPPKLTLGPEAGFAAVSAALAHAGARGVAVMDGERFVGLVDANIVAALEGAEDAPRRAADLVQASPPMITPETTLADLVARFRQDERPTFAVVDPAEPGKLIGCVRARDAFALAVAVFDRQRRDDLGLPREQ